MKYAYTLFIGALLCVGSAAYAQPTTSATDDAKTASPSNPSLDASEDSVQTAPSEADAANDVTESAATSDIADDEAPADLATTQDAQEATVQTAPPAATIQSEEEEFDNMDFSDTAHRPRMIHKICDATCTGSGLPDRCMAGCSDQTNACFAQCDDLTSNKNDCFIDCTHIAVEQRNWDEKKAKNYLDTSDIYGRKFAFGMNFSGGLHYVPDFLIDAFFQLDKGHWSDRPKYFYGGEFVFRFDDKNDFLISIDYADYTTPDGWWLQKNNNATAADWVQNDLHTLNLTFVWNGILNLDKKKRFQFYGGIGLGLMFRMGEFKKAKARLECVSRKKNIGGGAYVTEALPTSIFKNELKAPFDATCPTQSMASGSHQVFIHQDASGGKVTQWENEGIPKVLPALLFNVGLRYIIADYVSIGVEAGWKNVGFFGGVKIGFVVGKKNAAIAKEQKTQKLKEALEADKAERAKSTSAH